MLKQLQCSTMLAAVQLAQQPSSSTSRMAKQQHCCSSRPVVVSIIEYCSVCVCRQWTGNASEILLQRQAHLAGNIGATTLMPPVCLHELLVMAGCSLHACCLCCSLYRSLTDVYYPLLGIEQQNSGNHQGRKQQVDPHLQELLLHVQAGLGKIVRGADASQVCLSCRTVLRSSACRSMPCNAKLLHQSSQVSELAPYSSKADLAVAGERAAACLQLVFVVQSAFHGYMPVPPSRAIIQCRLSLTVAPVVCSRP